MTNQPPLYALRSFAQGQFQMAKFSMPDFNVEAVYNLVAKGSGWTCDCPAGQRTIKLRPCKHQRMMPFMMGAANLNRFYEPETRGWIEPLSPDLAALVASEASESEGIAHANQQIAAEAIEQKVKEIEEVIGDPWPLAKAEQATIKELNVIAEDIKAIVEPPKLRRRV